MENHYMTFKKTSVDGYMKNPETNVVINMNTSEYEAYKSQRARFLKQKALEDKVEAIESDISEIKALLLKVLEKKND